MHHDQLYISQTFYVIIIIIIIIIATCKKRIEAVTYTRDGIFKGLEKGLE
jgi:hypothetical protein